MEMELSGSSNGEVAWSPESHGSITVEHIQPNIEKCLNS